MSLHDLVDLDRYPIDRPGTEAFDAMLTAIREDLARDGCAVLRGFAHEGGLKALCAEADAQADKAHRSFGATNVYFSQDDPALPSSHPARQFFERSNAFVPADHFSADGPLRRIYEDSTFMPFIRHTLQEPEERFFRYDDPLADVIVNLAEEGEGFPWHFDTNAYTVTLAIQNSIEGGAFEYVPGIRTTQDENFDAVSSVLAGRRETVRVLELRPGDLQIFRGRFSLHRVAPLRGARRRYVGIFSFVETEGMCGGVERTRQLYGRVLAHHYERAGLRGDTLRD